MMSELQAFSANGIKIALDIGACIEKYVTASYHSCHIMKVVASAHVHFFQFEWSSWFSKLPDGNAHCVEYSILWMRDPMQ